MTRRAGWTYVVSGIALAGILIVTALVQRTTPTDADWQSPITVAGTIGEPASGRNIEATVHGVRLAQVVADAEGWTGETTGVWVVVDVTAEAVVDETAATLGGGLLVIGDTTYSASKRPSNGSLLGWSLSVGIPSRGPLFFEVAADDVADGELRLAISDDPRLDSQLVIPLDLAGLAVEPLITTDEVTWGER